MMAVPPSNGGLKYRRCGVLALDLGVSLGVALVWGAPYTWSFTVSLGKTIVERQRRLDRLLLFLHRRFSLQAVAYERVLRHAGVRAAHVYGALEARVLTFADRYSLTVFEASPAEIKRNASGKGNADKAAMIAAARARFGMSDDGVDDEADALALLDLVLRTYYKLDGLKGYITQCLEKK